MRIKMVFNVVWSVQCAMLMNGVTATQVQLKRSHFEFKHSKSSNSSSGYERQMYHILHSTQNYYCITIDNE